MKTSSHIKISMLHLSILLTVYFVTSFKTLLLSHFRLPNHLHRQVFTGYWSLVIDTSNNASYNQVHWLVRTPNLSIKASNVLLLRPSWNNGSHSSSFISIINFPGDALMEWLPCCSGKVWKEIILFAQTFI